MRDVCADFGVDLAEFQGPGHVNLLLRFPPTVAAHAQPPTPPA
jgi:hypothetical protein